MGHIRLGVLPKSKKWEQVIALLDGGAAVQTIVASAAEAAEGALKRAAGDPGFSHAFWLLTQLPLAACQADFAGELRRLGLRVGKSPGLFVVPQPSERKERAKVVLARQEKAAACSFHLAHEARRDFAGRRRIRADDGELPERQPGFDAGRGHRGPKARLEGEVMRLRKHAEAIMLLAVVLGVEGTSDPTVQRRLPFIRVSMDDNIDVLRHAGLPDVKVKHLGQQGPKGLVAVVGAQQRRDVGLPPGLSKRASRTFVCGCRSRGLSFSSDEHSLTSPAAMHRRRYASARISIRRGLMPTAPSRASGLNGQVG